MKNRHEVLGPVTVIYLEKRDGSLVPSVIDTEHLCWLRQFSVKWFPAQSRNGQIYARAHLWGQTIRLHRLLTNAPAHLVVDHINHNTLDNRLENLRVVKPTSNALNRSGPNRDNRSSGMRGVHWDAHAGKWKARVKRHGQSAHLGLFESKRAAAEAVAWHLRKLGEIVHVG